MYLGQTNPEAEMLKRLIIIPITSPAAETP